MDSKKIIVIEGGLVYLYPHQETLIGTHPSIRGCWRKCGSLLKGLKGALLAPLLVDDIRRPGELAEQTIEEILNPTLGANFLNRRPWLGPVVYESHLAATRQSESCVVLDSAYQLSIIQTIGPIYGDWERIVIHPSHFRQQQSEMLAHLWSVLSGKINWGAISPHGIKSEVYREQCQDDFLSRWKHCWIADDGTVEAETRPKRQRGEIVHVSR